MTLETETVLDRRRLRRRLTLWRALAVAAAALAIGAVVMSSDQISQLTGGKQIARIAIEGTILENRDQLTMLKRIADADSVEALLVYVNSPGGTTTGGEAIYEGLREIAKKKPVVAQFGTIAASAGYIVGLGTDHIVARGNTITGSVGVLVQWPEVSGLLDKLGVKVNEIKSGELKAVPSLFEPVDEAGRKLTADMVAESFRWFLSLVETRRNIKVADVPDLEKGRIYSGRDALRLKLVDELGGEDEAVRWLEDKRNITKNLKVVDWKPQPEGSWGFARANGGIVRQLFGDAALELGQMLARDPNLSTLGLDGLVSVWQPSEK